jgi:Mce-associated membrane protein
MANPPSRGRGTGSPARRTLPAAARAAAKRAQRVDHARAEEPPVTAAAETAEASAARHSGRTVLIEAEGGWEDPPEPVLEPEEEGEEEREAAPWHSARGLLTLVSAVVLVAGLVAVVVLGWRYEQGRRTQDAREQALAAAQEAAPAVLSYDYRQLNGDFARARAYLTGHFREQYGKTTATVVGPTARKYHGVVKATVAAPGGGGSPAASVVSASPDRVVVLLFVNQVTRSTQVDGSRLDLNRVRMTMTRTGSGWKVSAVDAL